MAIEEQVLREISENVQRVGDSSESFRFTAAQQNNNIQKIVKDISAMFRSQSQAQIELSGSIDDVRQAMEKNSERTDAVASSLEETINVQNSMLGELRGIGKGIDNLSSNINNMMIMMQQMGSGGGGAGGGGGSGGGAGIGRLGRILLGVGGAAAVASPFVAAYLNTRNDNTRGGNNQTGSGSNTEIDSLVAAIKKRESGGEAGFGRDPYKAIARDNSGNPIEGATASGAYQFTDATWKQAAAMAGVSTEEFPRALNAPPEVQDRVAKQYINYLREKAGGDASLVPVAFKGGEKYLDPEYRRQNMNNDLQQYQQDVMSNAQSSSVSPSSSPGSSEDYAKFLAEKAQSNVNVEKLNPGFAKNLVAAIQAAKEATGEDVLITSAYRSPEQQAQLYADYIQGPYEYKGKIYQGKGNPRPPMAAEPGNSAHETGKAVDLSSGKAREWIRANAAKFGLKDLAGDDPHFSDTNARPEGEPNQQEITPRQTRDATEALMSSESAQGSLMAGLGMPAGMGPGSEPIPIGMQDMSSYNPMGIMGALMGGNMLGPSGQMGAIGAALNVAGGFAEGMLSPEPDTRASVLNQAAAEQSAQAGSQWRDPGAIPGYQPPSREEVNRGQRIDPETYNHPEDRIISPTWSDRIMGMFPQETGGILPTRR